MRNVLKRPPKIRFFEGSFTFIVVLYLCFIELIEANHMALFRS